MGRVFDAMRRHSVTDNNGNAAKTTADSEHRTESPRVTNLPSAEQIEEQLLSGSTIMSVHTNRCEVQRPLRTLRMYPAGRHSPAELLRVMLGQLWALPRRRAPRDSSLMTFLRRASNLT